MLVACRLAGLSALEAHYAGVRERAQMRGHWTPSNLGSQRNGISRLPQVEGKASAKRKFKPYPTALST